MTDVRPPQATRLGEGLGISLLLLGVISLGVLFL